MAPVRGQGRGLFMAGNDCHRGQRMNVVHTPPEMPGTLVGASAEQFFPSATKPGARSLRMLYMETLLRPYTVEHGVVAGSCVSLVAIEGVSRTGASVPLRSNAARVRWAPELSRSR